MELSSVLSSPRMTSYLLLLQHGDDLTDSAGHRLMTSRWPTATTVYLKSNHKQHSFFVFSALINNHNIYRDEGVRWCVCVWIWLLQSVVNLIRKNNIYEAFCGDTVRREKANKRRKRRKRLEFWPCNHNDCRDQLPHQCFFWSEYMRWQRADSQGCSPSMSVSVMGDKHARHVHCFANQQRPFWKTNMCMCLIYAGYILTILNPDCANACLCECVCFITVFRNLLWTALQYV